VIYQSRIIEAIGVFRFLLALPQRVLSAGGRELLLLFECIGKSSRGYSHSIALDPQSRDKTAFTVTDRPLYQFSLMPFGLCSYMSTMSRLVNRVVPAHLRNEVFIYLNDLLRVSFSFQGHLNVLRELALHITHAGSTLNIAKSQFCMRRLRFLGYIIGDGWLQTDPESLAANTDFPLPKGLKSLQSLMGLCGGTGNSSQTSQRFLHHWPT